MNFNQSILFSLFFETLFENYYDSIMTLITQIIIVTWNNLIKTYVESRKVFLELDKKI